MKITGVLENWYWDKSFSIIWGRIFGDSKHRFPDGTRIHTSLINKLKYMNAKEGDIVKTLNSRYKLGKPMEKTT